MLQLAHIGSGSYEPMLLLSLTAISLAYVLRVRTLRNRRVETSFARQVSFLSGMMLIVLAVVSPLGHLSQELLSAHMVQHLLVMDLGALLLALGLSGPILQPLLRTKPFQILRRLAHPAVMLPLWALNLYLWHLPQLYQATLHSELLHASEHSLFIGLGVGIWLPLFGPLPMPAWFTNGAKMLYIVAVRALGALLANIFIWSGTVFYPDYARGEKIWGISPLADQGTAGQIMMIEGSILTLILFAWLFFRAANESEEKQKLLEFADNHGVALDEARAARAAAAGTGADLRKRVAAGSGGSDFGLLPDR